LQGEKPLPCIPVHACTVMLHAWPAARSASALSR
jgi:hypothetical protein